MISAFAFITKIAKLRKIQTQMKKPRKRNKTERKKITTKQNKNQKTKKKSA